MQALSIPTSGDLPVPILTDNSRKVLERRYLEKDIGGNIIEDPKDLFWRVANAVAQAEQHYSGDVEYYAREFYRLMSEFYMMPNTPTLLNAGKGRDGNLSACFVIPIADTAEGILRAVEAQALTLKWGGGTGFAGSRLRPAGDPIQTVHASACGPVAVLKLLNQNSKTWTQGGVRQGANMFVLDVSHPDIHEFIHCKDEDPQAISHFNISVGISDAFMEAVEQDGEFSLVNPRTGRITGIVRAKDLWDEIIASAHKHGDPGLLFLDAANRDNPLKHVSLMEASNPCGEQILLPWESCNLAHLNLGKYIHKGSFDYQTFGEDITTTVRFLDNVVDVNQFPTQEQADMNQQTRRIGLGVMGWHDALIKMRIPYESPEALETAHLIGAFFQDTADKASLELGEERGVYGAWKGSEHEKLGFKYRNAWRVTVAPTGTTSIIADASSGIEPLFSLAHERKMHDGPTMLEIYEPLQEELASGELSESEITEVTKKLLAGKSLEWAIPACDEWSEAVVDLYKTAMEVSAKGHVMMQAAWQKHIDSGISKTINLPRDASIEDVADSYLLAWQLGCKGVTVFVDGCRGDSGQVLSHVKEDVAAEVEKVVVAAVDFLKNGNGNGVHYMQVLPEHTHAPRRRLPDERPSVTHKFSVGGQEGYLTVGLHSDGTPGEVFIKCAKEGSTVQGLLDGWAATMSISLQYGVPMTVITNKLKNTRFEPSGMTINPDIRMSSSLLDYLARWLERRFAIAEDAPVVMTTASTNGHNNGYTYVSSGVTCPDCGSVMHAESGCYTCGSCGYSKCG